MSTLISKGKVSKILVTNEDGEDEEFSGEGFLLLRGHGSKIKVVELVMKVQK